MPVIGRPTSQAGPRERPTAKLCCDMQQTIESLVLDSYAELVSTATVVQWLGLGAEGFARQRLQTLAQHGVTL